MRQLLYTSVTKRDLADSVIEEILAASRRNNSAAQISGVLLYHDGGFMQVLEGPHDAVEETYQRIAADTRHRNTLVLLKREAPRVFQEWSMGFVKPTEVNLSAGAFEMTRNAILGKLDQAAGPELMVFLANFYKMQTGLVV
jgi:hypothetical protein